VLNETKQPVLAKLTGMQQIVNLSLIKN